MESIGARCQILCREFKEINYDIITEKMSNPIIFDTKDIIKNVPDGIKLYNYGNLYDLKN